MSHRARPHHVAALVLVGGLLLGGCGGGLGGAFGGDGGSSVPTAVDDKAAAGEASADGSGEAARGGLGRAVPDAGESKSRVVRPRQIPALGPKTRAAIPRSSRQAVVVTGDAPDSNRATLVLYERDPVEGWRSVSDPWPAHNALKGWTDEHRQGDLRSPIGVFGLTDAGGRLPDPGTRLPYDQGPAFTLGGVGFEGEPLAGSFDHVVAINYNRKAGTTPLDWTRPLGASRGGGIWIHVDHGGPTQGCVSLPMPRMKELLRWLDPSKRPQVVMGDVSSLGL
ncbi:L,D-transpeptidase family protein [Streptomyces sp. NPDC058653]|uniref:L,D-transpeptidase family protein n=1 Tax=Streptomyces sp. NPDC058653 TaxID=3346576 RepID=UPI003656D762